MQFLTDFLRGLHHLPVALGDQRINILRTSIKMKAQNHRRAPENGDLAGNLGPAENFAQAHKRLLDLLLRHLRFSNGLSKSIMPRFVLDSPWRRRADDASLCRYLPAIA